MPFKVNNGKTIQKKYSYTKGISFSDILDEIIDLLTDLNYENNH